MAETHHHICPRNCYDTCSIISHVQNGKLVSVEGDPSHEYTHGRLCSKAQDDVQKVYSPQRVRYPMRQRERFNGDWERISWDEAFDHIAHTILRLKKKYDSTLPIALNKYSGNLGALHNAMEGLLSGLGPTTRAIGSPCWSAGIDAQIFDFGAFACSDPIDMKNAKLIWIWGGNPVWTAIHQMPIIYQAIDNGAKLVCFDTHFTASAARAHRFIQVEPGMDGLLALAMAKIIVDAGLTDPALEEYSLGSKEFLAYIQSEIDVEKAAQMTGVPVKTMEELALEYGRTHPACIWVGFGLQRYTNGGQTLRAIDALGALTGHIGEKGGGVQYGQFATWCFSEKLQNPHITESATNSGNMTTDRLLSINNFAEEALKCETPPVKLLWFAGRNPLSQDAEQSQWLRLIKQLDLIIINDLFFSKSSEAADLFLPVTTHYEHWDLHASYWHHWIGVNEPAIQPVGETKSDLQIAWGISARLNQLRKGSCSFPTSGSEKETLLGEIGDKMMTLLDLKDREELLNQPVHAHLPQTVWSDHHFATPSGKYEFYSQKAEKSGFSPLPVFTPPLLPPPHTPLRLLTPHHSSTLNSQSYSGTDADDYIVHLSAASASRYDLTPGSKAIVYNDLGQIEAVVSVNPSLPNDTLVIYQESLPLHKPRINDLLSARLTDMGRCYTGAAGLAFNETFVNIKRSGLS